MKSLRPKIRNLDYITFLNVSNTFGGTVFSHLAIKTTTLVRNSVNVQVTDHLYDKLYLITEIDE
jgi:hypothetical protein